ncbi:MAG: ATP synthase F0 subunit C [Phycisphaerae bacterium]|nr:ATP synthase F0 subunit C [Phycisphaerae bacterium]
MVSGVLALSGSVALAAQEEGAATEKTGAPAEEADAAAEAAPSGGAFTDTGLARIGGCLGAGLVLMGGATAIGRIGSAAVESMARQPEASGSINGATVITAAMVEGATLFGVVVCLLAVL